MNILKARHLGFCFGVRDAVALALNLPGPVTILGDLVHNESILQKLEERGIASVRSPEDLPGGRVLVTAHGTSQRQLDSLRARDLEVVEATCPLVRYAHRTVLRLAQAGYHPVIIGKKGHVEVNGLVGDLENFDIALDEAGIDALVYHPRFGVISQTTQPIDRVRRLVRRLQERYPESIVQFVDTVCRPTKDRQSAAIALAKQCDVVVVIGGAQSNNTRELVLTAEKFCPRVYQVQSAADLQESWFEGATRVGLTAGTSTPAELIEAVEAQLGKLNETFFKEARP